MASRDLAWSIPCHFHHPSPRGISLNSLREGLMEDLEEGETIVGLIEAGLS